MPARRTPARTPPPPPFDPARREDLDGFEEHERLGEDETYDRAVFRGRDLTGALGTDSRFLECAVVDCDLTGAGLSRTRWSEAVLSRVRGTGVDLSEAQLADVWLSEARLGAAAAYGGSWRGVRVTGGKLDFLNLRGAKLVDVWFEDVVLVEPDLAGATLERVSFDGCQLVTPQLSGVTLTDVDLSGARLVDPQGLASLRGATLSRLQLLDLADALAAQLGIRVTG